MGHLLLDLLLGPEFEPPPPATRSLLSSVEARNAGALVDPPAPPVPPPEALVAALAAAVPAEADAADDGAPPPASDDGDDGPTCRFCFCGSSDGELIAPCKCAGSMLLVHRDCLDECRAAAFDPSALVRCGLCRTDYVLETRAAGPWGPRAELAASVVRYAGGRILLSLLAASILGFAPRALLGRRAAHRLRVAENPIANHVSLGGVLSLAASGAYWLPLDVTRHLGARGRFRPGGRDDSLESMVMFAVLVVCGAAYAAYHLAVGAYNVARTGVPVAFDTLKSANRDVRRAIARKYRVADRRKARPGPGRAS